MRPSFKSVVAIDSVGATNATNGATVTGNIDTQGYDALVLDVRTSTSNNATNNLSVLKLSESDDTVVTNFANVSGHVGDSDFTIANAYTSTTSGSWMHRFEVDLRGRKRYLKVSASPLTTQGIDAAGFLYRGDVTPVSTTSSGVVSLSRT